MKKSITTIAAFAVMCLLAFGINQNVKAQGQGVSSYQTLTQLVTNPCTGEPVLLSGDLHIVGFILTNSQGVHLNLHVQAKKVTGTGLNSGKVWKVKSNRSESVLIGANCGQGPVSYNNSFRLQSTGQPQGDDYTLHQNYTITFPCGQPAFVAANNLSVTCQ